MFSYFTKAFITLAAIAAVTASPVKHDGLTTCNFVLQAVIPIDPATTDLLAEFNFAIGHTLAVTVPSGATLGKGGATWVDNGDNTFNVQDTIGAVGETSAQTAAIIEGWLGTTIIGFMHNWFVESVNCG